MGTNSSKRGAAIAAVLLVSLLSLGSVSAEPAEIRTPASSIPTDVRAAYDGRISIPLRDLAKAIGAKLVWNRSDGTLSLSKWDRTYTFTVGSGEYDNGMNAAQHPMLSEPVRSIGGRAYIEATFLRVMGYEIGYGDGKLTIASPLGEKTRATLYSGDLAAARRLAIGALQLRYEHAELPPKTITEGYGYSYLFPEGEALRFYRLHGDVASFVEVKEDYAVVTAQAHFADGYADLKKLLSGQMTDLVGTFPEIGKSFFAYETFMFGVSSSETVSRVQPDGSSVLSGGQLWIDGDLNQDYGEITYVMDGEKRTDAR